MNFAHSWKNMKIKRKVLLLFLSLNIVSILLVLLPFTIVLSLTVKEDINENAAKQLQLITAQTEEILSNANYNIKAFSTSSTLQNAILETYSDDDYGTYLFSSALHNSVHNIMDIDSLISNGYIQTYDGKVYDVKSGKVSRPDTGQKEAYELICSNGGRIISSPPTNNSGKSALNLSKSLIDINTGRILGVLSFDIKESVFYDAYRPIQSKQSGDFFVINNKHTIISSNNRDTLQKNIDSVIKQFPENSEHGVNTYFHEEEQRVFLIMKSADANFQFIYRLNYYTLYKETILLSVALLISGAVIMVLTIVLTRRFADNITRPLIRLSDYAKAIGAGNFNTQIRNDTNDEIGILTSQFQEMNTSIKNLTANIFIEQNQKREYELSLLQAQINPHFLYNCLDNVNSLVVDGEKDITVQMVSHLGEYYRLVLSKGRNIITIQEEMDLIVHYLEIQQIKTPELFTYELDILDSLKECSILKMLLQPLVENSVIHGFMGYKNNRKITIKAFLVDSDIIVVVSDDGRGMTQNQADNVFSPPAAAIPKSFGLRNVHSRIQLKFGCEYGLQVSSKAGVGTTVTVKYPKYSQ